MLTLELKSVAHLGSLNQVRDIFDGLSVTTAELEQALTAFYKEFLS